MRIFLSALLAALLCVELAFAQSAVPMPPAPPADDALGTLIAERGLLGTIGTVGSKVGNQASDLVATTLGFLGVPYRRGGATLETGFDCSGFVKYMFENTLGLVLPRSAAQQAAATEKIDSSELKPGDLVFFNTMRRTFSHVGIYVGNGKFIHSPKPGGEVRIEDMKTSYWARRFDGARRVATDPTADSK
jgi:cell wall-associated NlpC family hydrolase